MPVPHPSGRRAEKVVNDVVLVLAPLLDQSKLPQFKIELFKVAEDAISVWASAEADERNFIVTSTLDHTNRNEWQPTTFGPPSPSSDGNALLVAHMPSIPQQIFTLFPSITARKHSEASGALPGSWPDQEQQQHIKETSCVHAGIGLPEWSELVLRGREEQEDIQESWNRVQEQWRKKIHENAERSGQHIRSGSMRGFASGPSSPTAQRMNGRSKQLIEH